MSLPDLSNESLLRRTGRWVDHAILRTCGWINRWDRRDSAIGPERQLTDDKREVFEGGATIARRYELEHVLGRGGMGRVWLAHDRHEDRNVVVKEVRSLARAPGRETDDIEVAFKREYHTMSKLQHPNTVQVQDSGTTASGVRFIVMEYVRGQDLSSRIDEEPLDWETTGRYLVELARVLGYIHSRLYVHCDIKSDNVRVTPDGTIKLMDFGVMHQLGTPGAIKGTPKYMAPEVFQGAVIDARTDLYSLGILGYEMLTGHTPFQANTFDGYAEAHLEEPPPDLPEHLDVPGGVEEILRRLLAKEPGDRFETAAELIEELSETTGVESPDEDYESRASYLYSADLVGRDEEFDRLERAVDDVVAGSSRSVLIAGSAGVGKSRLLQEFRLQSKFEDVPFCVGRARAEGQSPLTPIASALSQLVSVAPDSAVDGLPPVLRSLLSTVGETSVDVEDSDAPEEFEQIELVSALKDWLQTVASVQPFILCIEDLHWADAGSVKLLNAAIRALHDSHGMATGTFRPGDLGGLSRARQTVYEDVAELMTLGSLTARDTRELVESMLGAADLEDAFVEKLHASTDGNAFFITEVLRWMMEEETLRLTHGRWEATQSADEIDVPDSIQEVATARIETLTAPALELCQSIAPFGRLIELDILRQVLDRSPDEMFELLDTLMERQFIIEHEDEKQLYFVHDTVQDAVYQSMSEDRRRRAHRAIGEALEANHAGALEEHVATLGYHFGQADVHDKAVDYLRRAGNQAAQRDQLRTATDLLTDAADQLEEMEGPGVDDQRVAVWAKITRLGFAGHPPSSAEYGDKLCAFWKREIDLEEGTRRVAERTRQLVDRWWDPLQDRKLESIWGDVPLEPESRDPLHVVPKFYVSRILQLYALSSLGNVERVHEILEEEFADNEEAEPFRTAAYCSNGIGLKNQGKWTILEQRARDEKREVEKHLDDVGHMPGPLWTSYAAALHLLCLQRAMSGRTIDEETWNRADELIERFELTELRWLLRGDKAVLSAISGDPELVDTQLDWLSDELERIGRPLMLESRFPIWVGPYWLQRHEYDPAREVCQEIEMWADRVEGDEWLPVYSATFWALYSVRSEGQSEARARIDAAFDELESFDYFRLEAQLHCAHAEISARESRPEEARDAIQRALELATTEPTRSVWDEIVARRTRGKIVGGAEGLEEIEESIRLADQWGHDFHEGLGLFEMARLRDRADLGSIRGPYERAYEVFERLRCGELLEQLEEFRIETGR